MTCPQSHPKAVAEFRTELQVSKISPGVSRLVSSGTTLLRYGESFTAATGVAQSSAVFDLQCFRQSFFHVLRSAGAVRYITCALLLPFEPRFIRCYLHDTGI